MTTEPLDKNGLEAAKKAFAPDLFGSDPRAAHQDASPLSLDSAMASASRTVERVVAAYLAALPRPTGGTAVRVKANVLSAWIDRLQTAKKLHGIPLTVNDMLSEMGQMLAALDLSQAPDTPTEAKPVCPYCKGTGQEADYVGPEMRCVASTCSHCNGEGFDPDRTVKSVRAAMATVTQHRYIDGKDFAKSGPVVADTSTERGGAEAVGHDSQSHLRTDG